MQDKGQNISIRYSKEDKNWKDQQLKLSTDDAIVIIVKALLIVK